MEPDDEHLATLVGNDTATAPTAMTTSGAIAGGVSRECAASTSWSRRLGARSTRTLWPSILQQLSMGEAPRASELKNGQTK